jgi:flagellar assembly protein FliH
MSLYKIIKAVEVQENLLHVLPLRSCTTLLERASFNYRDNKAADAAAGLMDQAAVQAEGIVGRARASADDIIGQAQLAAEQIKEEAYQNAFEKGHQAGQDAGYREGIAKGEEEAAAIRAQAAQVLEQAEKIRRHTLEALEREIVDLARDIAEKLLSAQLSLEPGMVMQVAAESLRLVSDRVNPVLYVNPLELELVESRRSMLLDVLPARAQLQVIADSSIQTGGCKIETEQGWVDATMETRLKELIKALYGS